MTNQLPSDLLPTAQPWQPLPSFLLVLCLLKVFYTGRIVWPFAIGFINTAPCLQVLYQYFFIFLMIKIFIWGWG